MSSFPPFEATGAPPVRAGSDMLQRSFSDDPESWSVEEVILFLKQKDPQISGLLADSFREHVMLERPVHLLIWFSCRNVFE